MKLSVIVATCRPHWLANCLQQYKVQSKGDLQTEIIVVSEGGNRDFFGPVIDAWPVDRWESVDTRSPYGVASKDLGISLARGEYVCIWDDDNIYYPHALATLYATAKGHDIGIVGAGHQIYKFDRIPFFHFIEKGQIDSMSFAVKRELAASEKWADWQEEPITGDYQWISKLAKKGATIGYSDFKIGEKLHRWI